MGDTAQSGLGGPHMTRGSRAVQRRWGDRSQASRAPPAVPGAGREGGLHWAGPRAATSMGNGQEGLSPPTLQRRSRG